MASLWSKLTWRGTRKLEGSHDSDASTNVLFRRSSSVKSRKSLSDILNLGKPVKSDEATCQEATHYPLYNPTNPDHSNTTTFPAPLTPKKPRLQHLADTIKASANFLHAMRGQDLSGSPLSSPSKKSVRFRAGHTEMDKKAASSITIPESSPKLPKLNIPHTPLFPAVLTARPSPSKKPTLGTGGAISSPEERPAQRSIPDSPIPELPTPMPGTNLPLNDPFESYDLDAIDDACSPDMDTCPVTSLKLQTAVDHFFVSKKDEEDAGALEYSANPKQVDWEDPCFNVERHPMLTSSSALSGKYDTGSETSNTEVLPPIQPSKTIKEHHDDQSILHLLEPLENLSVEPVSLGEPALNYADDIKDPFVDDVQNRHDIVVSSLLSNIELKTKVFNAPSFTLIKGRVKVEATPGCEISTGHRHDYSGTVSSVSSIDSRRPSQGSYQKLFVDTNAARDLAHIVHRARYDL